MAMKDSTRKSGRRPTDPEERFRHDVVRRLNAMVNLLTHVDGKDRSMTQRIHLLGECGLTATEIGEVVGKEVKYVATILGRKKGANE